MARTYTGPKSKKGLKLKGRLWEKPWNWKSEEIETNIAKDPSLEKYFSEETTPTNKVAKK